MPRDRIFRIISIVLVSSLLLPISAESQFVVAENTTFSISDAKTSVLSDKSEILISLNISPVPKINDNQPLYIFIFAPKEGANDSLKRLDISNFKMNLTLSDQGAALFTFRMEGKDGHRIGPLVMQDLSKDDVRGRGIRVRLKTKLPPIFEERFPITGKIELAIGKPKKSGEGTQFVITSNIILIELPD